MFNFAVFHCGVKCSISITLLSNRVNLLNRWSLVDESIRCLNLLEINHRKRNKTNNTSTNLSNRITYAREKKVQNRNTNLCF